MIEALIGFASGVGTALIGALICSVLQRRNENRKKIEETQFQVYMKLMDVYNLYFWVTSLEIRGEEVTSEHKRRIREETWKIADLLRFEDKTPFAEDILHVLMSNEYPSTGARHDAMGAVLDKLGTIVNPRYQGVIKGISNANVMRVGSGERSTVKSTTPGSMGPL